jgi:ergothioneine biosynthesis protein EgtB
MQTRRTPLALTSPSVLEDALRACRAQTLALAEGLSDADATVQSMPDASPAKWHLAHTTWFFEQFVLRPAMPGYGVFNPQFTFLFNSYYETVGPRQPRAQRGLLSRPSLEDVKAYRRHVDDALAELVASPMPGKLRELVELGVQHEQQHQELFLTDLLHLFAQNPLRPAYRQGPELAPAAVQTAPLRWIAYPGGIQEVGHSGPGFGFDCEAPAHPVLLRPYALADRPVTNREWCEFIDAGGYRDPQWWLSDGWVCVQSLGWCAPLYWRNEAGTWLQMTLHGEKALEMEAPVSHVSFFEADAFARWRGARLPTEFEWEVAARSQGVEGQFSDSGRFRPLPNLAGRQVPLGQLYGGVWEWTASPFVAYPGFKTAPGAVGEYNGKFMSGQFVLRGGSCATPKGHVRASYRNFFYPGQRWQFSGVRLAEDR